MNQVDASELTTFEVAADGSRFRISFRDQDGHPAAVSLPTGCINQLMMTLPAILRRALKNQYDDETLRLVYPIGESSVEKSVGKCAVVLNSKTPDGFEVSFEYNRRQLAQLSEAIADAEYELDDHARCASLLS